MSNSSLVNYKNISPNRTSPRNHVIDTITIHCIGYQHSPETVAATFCNPKKQCSANYSVGPDGRIGMFVEEKDRAWTSGGTDKNGNPIYVNGISGGANDHRAITIEVACDPAPPNAVNKAAYDSLVKLCADICKRNNIKELKWSNNKSLVGKIDQQNMTVHQWFCNTSCPGNFLMAHMGDIANDVNAIIKPIPTPDPVKPEPAKEMYRVRKTWEDAKSQKGAYSVLDNAIKCANSNPGYNVYNSAGKQVYPEVKPIPTPTPTPEKKEMYRVRKSWADSKSQKGAYSVLQNAINCANANPGYQVYDSVGKQVYPAIASIPTPTPVQPTPTTPKQSGYKLGDYVTYTKIYRSSDSTTPLTPNVKSGKITRIVSGAKNPYLIGDGIGWVNDSVIK